MKHDYAIRNTMDGKKAVTLYDMGEATESFGSERTGRRLLMIETQKGYQRGTLRTGASAGLFFQNGVMTHVFGGSKGDFRATVKITPCARVTEKAIRTQHEALAGEFETVLAQARAHYEAQTLMLAEDH